MNVICLRSTDHALGRTTQYSLPQLDRSRCCAGRRRGPHHVNIVPIPCVNNSDASNDDTSLSAATSIGKLAALDLNQLQTALNKAVANEDYALASTIRDVITLAFGSDRKICDWKSLGIVDWLAERAEQLGYRLPTEVQQRAAPLLLDHDDCIIRSETGSGKTLSFLLPLLSQLSYPPETYPDDLKGPLLLILVPTRELGVQVVMLIYKLFGGSINPGIPGERANIFQFNGPRGIKVKGLLLEDELEAAVFCSGISSAHVVVGTPPLVAAAILNGAASVAAYCSALAVDEVDACFEEFPEAMKLILNRTLIENANLEAKKPVVALVGATLDDSLADTAVQKGWLKDPVVISVGKEMKIPSGLSHRYIVVEESNRLATLARALRADLKGSSPDAPPARVMVFAESEDEAKNLSTPLRNVLWGEHAISVLLPQGSEPIKALHSFRDNKTTLLLATPAASRGLDLPAVSHVYNLKPPSSPADYLHRAGRAGRIGAAVPGVVITLVSSEEESQLLGLATSLGIRLTKADAPPLEFQEDDLDSMKKNLEDRFNLM